MRTAKNWSDWGDAQAYLSLCLAQWRAFCRFCHEAAYMIIVHNVIIIQGFNWECLKMALANCRSMHWILKLDMTSKTCRLCLPKLMSQCVWKNVAVHLCHFGPIPPWMPQLRKATSKKILAVSSKTHVKDHFISSLKVDKVRMARSIWINSLAG